MNLITNCPYLKKFYHDLLYGRVDKRFYEDNANLLNDTNYVTTRLCVICAAVIFFALCIFVQSVRGLHGLFWIYLGASLFYFGFSAFVIFYISKHKQLTQYAYYAYEISVYALLIVVGTVFSPLDLTVSFLVLLMVLPLIYIEKPIYSILMVVSATVVFCVTTSLVKTIRPEIARMDIMNASISLVVSCIFIHYVRNMHLRNIQATVIFRIQSETDALTGTLNKASVEQLSRAYLHMSDGMSHCAIIMLDIDNFKKINDTLGHSLGDELLRKVGKSLRSIFRTQDIVGRVGGDEFFILMKDIDDIDIVRKKAQDIEDAVENSFIEHTVEHFSCSIGIALSNAESLSFEELYFRADKALYQAKSNGKGLYVFYDQEEVLPDTTVPTMLIADSDLVSLSILTSFFEGKYNVLQTSDSDEAIELFEKNHLILSVVLTDISLLEKSNYGILRVSKSDSELRAIPIIVIAPAKTDTSVATALGAKDTIMKPFDPMDARTRVKLAVSSSHRRRVAAE